MNKLYKVTLIALMGLVLSACNAEDTEDAIHDLKKASSEINIARDAVAVLGDAGGQYQEDVALLQYST
ncbi:hypothetical protein HC723_13450 [Vibrio sp. S11_S32]|uniref:hypothetical protein n=1 Tax=Vibrio sp. S11_S32 TaxID=2720225 RepID=UPI001681B7AF|nr:hypothetical protein [Vibrio sp. S11_S32]MBD1577428.1 hypothetical protein [Vibrio sp. S11_S32]